ncbi:hypothetical protein BCR43DRAFT_499801 [Syncephalastrum racemosum]|uniref:Mid2 domain-containing protein n=1 Tax=Syncephalastrum racemosum TaxID=13706 RepID=A0A1X2GZU4_SYNRA|nr:hypothetical protein BCR43DRAFT_499801 [Syncephalastrum racemosum]
MKSISLFLIVASSVLFASPNFALPLQSSSLSTTTTNTPSRVFDTSHQTQQDTSSLLQRHEPSVASVHAGPLHVKRAAGSFVHEHSPAFNVVHVIAAIIGVLAAAAIGITAFVVCRRRNRRRRLSEKVPLPHESTPPATAHEPPSPSSAVHHKTSRFDQFASDFTYDERNASGCSSRPQPQPQSHAGVSPVMQQAELQSRLMQSVKVNPPPPPYQP